MILLTLEQLLEIHALVIDTTGGSGGLRDLGRLEAAIASQHQSVFGEELYQGVVNKSAAIMRGIVADHPFIDGNKRTAMLSALTLLALNKVEFHTKKGEIEDFAVKIATDHLDIPIIARWLEGHIK